MSLLGGSLPPGPHGLRALPLCCCCTPTGRTASSSSCSASSSSSSQQQHQQRIAPVCRRCLQALSAGCVSLTAGVQGACLHLVHALPPVGGCPLLLLATARNSCQQVCALVGNGMQRAALCCVACRVWFPVRWCMMALQKHLTKVPALPEPPYCCLGVGACMSAAGLRAVVVGWCGGLGESL